LNNKWEVIQRFRDIVNFGTLAHYNVMKVRDRFRRELLAAGHSYQNLEQLEEIAYSRTVFEPQLEHIQKPKGDMMEWIHNKGRWK